MQETRQQVYKGSWTSRQEYCDSVSYPASSKSGSWDFTHENSRSGSDNPNWRRLVASGEDATTSFSGVLSRQSSYSGGYVWLRYSPCHYGFWPRTLTASGCQSGRHALVPSAAYASITSALNQAKTRFVKNAKKHINPFQGMIVLGELNKTLRMLRRPLHSLVSEVRTYHSKLKKVSKRSNSETRKRALTDTYLELTYGVQPLLGDIDNALNLLARLRANRPFEIIRLIGRGKHEASGYEMYSTSCGDIGFINTDLCKDEYSVIIKGGLRVSAIGCDPLAAAGFSFGNFLPTAWELLPYSFLADYVANIGDIIDAFSLVNGRLAWCSQNVRRLTTRQSVSIVIDPAYLTNVVEKSFSPGYHRFSLKTTQRTKLASVIPDFGFRLPGFGSVQSLNTAILALRKTVKTPFY